MVLPVLSSAMDVRIPAYGAADAPIQSRQRAAPVRRTRPIRGRAGTPPRRPCRLSKAHVRWHPGCTLAGRRDAGAAV